MKKLRYRLVNQTTRFNQFDESVNLYWFGQVGNCSHLIGFIRIFRIRESGHYNKYRIRDSFFQALDQVEPGLPPQIDVNQNYFMVHGCKLNHGLFIIIGYMNLEIMFSKYYF